MEKLVGFERSLYTIVGGRFDFGGLAIDVELVTRGPPRAVVRRGDVMPFTCRNDRFRFDLESTIRPSIDNMASDLAVLDHHVIAAIRCCFVDLREDRHRA